MPRKAFLQTELTHDSLMTPPPTSLYLIPHPQQLSGTVLHTNPSLRDEVEFHPRRQIHSMPRRLDSKRQRISIDSSVLLMRDFYPNHTLATYDPHDYKDHRTQLAADRSEEQLQSKPKIDLNPCHICHRKPTFKSELDQYANCEGCDRRTCYICIRSCLRSTTRGSISASECCNLEDDHDMLVSFDAGDTFSPSKTRNGRGRSDSGYEGGDECHVRTIGKENLVMKVHRNRICSRCCVERGTDGEVLCLGCLRLESAC